MSEAGRIRLELLLDMLAVLDVVAEGNYDNLRPVGASCEDTAPALEDAPIAVTPVQMVEAAPVDVKAVPETAPDKEPARKRAAELAPIVEKSDAMALIGTVEAQMRKRDISMAQLSREAGLEYSILRDLISGVRRMRGNHAETLRAWVAEQGMEAADAAVAGILG